MPAVRVRGFRINPPSSSDSLVGEISVIGKIPLLPSPLRPPCRADQRVFLWRGIHTPPLPVIANQTIIQLFHDANRASLDDTGSAGAAIRKFHVFCDTFSIPESDRLPASPQLLHSFALWAAADPDPSNLAYADGTAFEPVSVDVVRKYLSGIRVWHIVQGFPPPLSTENRDVIGFSLRGLEKLQALSGRRKRPPRPPVTLQMLYALHSTLNLSDPFEACVWAAACCAFWGMMCFGEVSVKSRAAFNGNLHLKRSDFSSGFDAYGKPYIRLDLPSAKTARPGEIQMVHMAEQAGPLSPIKALENLSNVVPAGDDNPLFSWRDKQGNIRPLVKDAALSHINSILSTWGFGNTFGHSFRIGGASFFLGQGVDPEIVRLAGRWRSLAYETYIRAFEQVASRHMANLVLPPSITDFLNPQSHVAATSGGWAGGTL